VTVREESDSDVITAVSELPTQETDGEAADTLSPSLTCGTTPKDLSVQLVDPQVSRAKFDREIRNYHTMQSEYMRRGWLLIRSEYPEAVVLFAAPQLTPTPLLFGVRLDFTNYDFWPASVRFVHPLTLENLTFDQMHWHFWKRVSAGSGSVQPQPLLMHQADQVPFLCIKGVREYHSHPFHSNDPWLAYRNTGVGTLYHILNIIHRYGISPFREFGVQIRSMECAVGLKSPNISDIPE
jgi:hypothetical protein